MRKDVTIIIPTLNEEKFIKECISSVINQTFPFDLVNLLVIDGGSKDKTCGIVKKYAEAYSNIHLLQNPKKIQSVAFNIGVSNSVEPYIIRLDAHASYDKYYIEKCVSHLMNDKQIGNVGGRCLMRSKKNGIIAQANVILNQSKFGIGGAAFRVSTNAAYVDTVPFGAFRRTVVEQIGGMREDLARGEDNEYNSRIREAGFKVYFDPTIISTYFARETVSAITRQMYTNGVSIGKLLLCSKDSVGIRHFVPFLFVSCIIGCLGLGIFSPLMFLLLSIILLMYIALDLIATSNECAKFGLKYFFILPWLYFIVHISYGWGTIVGILQNIKKNESH